MKFRHEKLDVYQKAIEFLALAFGISLNLAKGNSKFSEKEKVHLLQIARGSANECSAILDACKVAEIIDFTRHEKGKSLLYAYMLVCFLK